MCDPLRVCAVQRVCVWQQSVVYSDVEALIRLDVDDGVGHGGQLQRQTEDKQELKGVHESQVLQANRRDRSIC